MASCKQAAAAISYGLNSFLVTQQQPRRCGLFVMDRAAASPLSAVGRMTNQVSGTEP